KCGSICNSKCNNIGDDISDSKGENDSIIIVEDIIIDHIENVINSIIREKVLSNLLVFVLVCLVFFTFTKFNEELILFHLFMTFALYRSISFFQSTFSIKSSFPYFKN